MRKAYSMIIVVLMLAWVGAALAADPPPSRDLKEVALVQAKDVKGEAKGKLVINTANGTTSTSRSPDWTLKASIPPSS